MQAIRGFDLDDELLVDNHVECLPGKWLSSIIDWDRDFAIYAMTSGHQVPLQSEGVDVLSKSETESPMDVIERADDGTRKCLLE
jgi:hypothetical protein